MKFSAKNIMFGIVLTVVCLCIIGVGAAVVRITDTGISIDGINVIPYKAYDCVVSNNVTDSDYQGCSGIQSCIDDLETSHGGTILIREGVYTACPEFDVRQRGQYPTTQYITYTITGDNKYNTVLQFPGNGFKFDLETNGNVGVVMKNLLLQGSNTGFGLFTNGSDYATGDKFPSYSLFEDLNINNFSRAISLYNASMISTTFRDVEMRNCAVGVYIKPTTVGNVFDNFFENVRAYDTFNYSWYLDGSLYTTNGIRGLTLKDIDVGDCRDGTSGSVGFYSNNIQNVMITSPWAECPAATSSGIAYILNGYNINLQNGNIYSKIYIGTNATTQNVHVSEPFNRDAQPKTIVIGSQATNTILDLGTQLLNSTYYTGHTLTISDSGTSTQVCGIFNIAGRNIYTCKEPVHIATVAGEPAMTQSNGNDILFEEKTVFIDQNGGGSWVNIFNITYTDASWAGARMFMEWVDEDGDGGDFQMRIRGASAQPVGIYGQVNTGGTLTSNTHYNVTSVSNGHGVFYFNSSQDYTLHIRLVKGAANELAMPDITWIK